MAQKIFKIEGVGPVVVAKRRGARNIRLSITPKGQVRVGLPYWLPYQAGLAFAEARRGWIREHLPEAAQQLSHNHRIGKSYRLKFAPAAPDSRLSARVSGNEIIIRAPAGTDQALLQKRARVAAARAMKREAETLLSIRLSALAKKHGYEYKSLKIKHLTSRWGSCSRGGQISLSLFLMQLPWDLIDYVILHELAHTRHANHGNDFWEELNMTLPGAKKLQKELKKHRPVIQGSIY